MYQSTQRINSLSLLNLNVPRPNSSQNLHKNDPPEIYLLAFSGKAEYTLSAANKLPVKSERTLSLLFVQKELFMLAHRLSSPWVRLGLMCIILLGLLLLSFLLLHGVSHVGTLAVQSRHYGTLAVQSHRYGTLAVQSRYGN